MIFFYILPIRSVTDVLRAQSQFVKFVGLHILQTYFGPKYVNNRPYNEFITPTTFM